MAVRRKTWIGSTLLLVVVVAAVVLVWFQPQKLLYDDAVDEAPPAADPVELATGAFVSHEHETTGTARVLRLPDGQVVVRLEGFATTNGPDLYVYLSAAPAGGPADALDDDVLDLGRLKGNVGDQNYALPAGADAGDWISVVIWCERFSASFGAADLAPSATV